jgi:hypothetical protein
MSLPVLSAADRCVICCRIHRQSIAVPCWPGMLWASALILCVFGLLSRQSRTEARRLCVALVVRVGAAFKSQR